MFKKTGKYLKIAAALTILAGVFYSNSAAAENASVSKKYRVAIFSGHCKNEAGKGMSGATSFGKRPEIYFNDTLSVRFEKASTGEIEYIVFKASDNIPLRIRPAIARCVRADACLEIHHDSAQKDDILKKRWSEMEGFSLFFHSGNAVGKKSLCLAEALGDEMIKNGFKPNHYHTKKIRGEGMNEIDAKRAIYDRDLFINLNAEVPTVLIECGCLESPDEEKMLLDADKSRKIYNSLVGGIESFVKDTDEAEVSD